MISADDHDLYRAEQRGEPVTHVRAAIEARRLAMHPRGPATVVRKAAA